MTNVDARDLIANSSYLVAALLFILTLRDLSSPRTARRGLLCGELGMLLAIVGTLVTTGIVRYDWILAGLALGSAIGVPMGLWIPMTKMPERIALSHSFGGLAAALVGINEYLLHGGAGAGSLGSFATGALGLEIFFGCLTFTGSLMAFGKLQGLLRGAPITYPLQNASNLTLFGVALLALLALAWNPALVPAFGAAVALGLALGVSFVLPIGGADMPVVISLLNSYAGLAAAATGFALGNPILIVAGALDGTSGFLLSMLMSRAMNRSFSNVLFGAVGTGDAPTGQVAGSGAAQPAQVATLEDATDLLAAAQSVIIVPGYGMAVSQAHHACRDLAAHLEGAGCSVKYAIHPVAGRMPGHMNVLLAEANIPYDQLFDLEEINDEFQRTQVTIVIGANDVVNPAARTQPGSPIFGMPIFDVERSGIVLVLKRGLSAGFAGIENELFGYKNTWMLLGDARRTLLELTRALKGERSLHMH